VETQAWWRKLVCNVHSAAYLCIAAAQLAACISPGVQHVIVNSNVAVVARDSALAAKLGILQQQQSCPLSAYSLQQLWPQTAPLPQSSTSCSSSSHAHS
jgi:hypothetical protein